MAIISELTCPKSDADDTMLVSKMYFSNNDEIKEGDELMDLETSKTAVVIEAPGNGFVEYKVNLDSSVEVGEILIYIHDAPFSEELGEKDSQVSISMNNKIISFAAESYIKNHSIDITNIGKHFITLQDVAKNDTRVIEKELHVSEKKTKSIIETISKPIRMAKQLEIDALSSVQLNGLVSTISINVEAFKIDVNDSLLFDASDSYLPLIAYESSQLLNKYPMLNSYFEHGSIFQYVDINIGIALDIDDGLKVYNIRNCNNLSLNEVKEKISEGIYHYLRKDLTVANISDSTFTITDLSQYGVSHFVPLVNNMQSGILGVSAIDKKLNRFALTLSFDHRVTEGKVVSKFLLDLSSAIEKYASN